MSLAIKIAITPKASGQASYEILDLIVVNGRAYLSLKDENTSAVTDTAAWMQITENTYDIAVRLGYVGTEEEWAGLFVNGVSSDPQELTVERMAQARENIGAFASADVVGLLGDSETKVVNQKASTINNLKSWSLAESFALSSPTFDDNGYISGGVITWPDGDVGSISNVTIGVHGITSIRYNRSEAGKYATVNIAYDGSGVVSNQTVVLTGF